MTTTRPTPLTVRTPEDVLALVPYVLGFVPSDSVVLLTTGDHADPFHARIDLPEHLADLDLVVETLVDAAERNTARTAMIVLYTGDHGLGLETRCRLEEALDRVRVETVLALRAHDGHYLVLDDPGRPPTPYDVSAHPLAAQAVLDGRVTFRTRAELAESLLPGPSDDVEAVMEACLTAAHRLEAARRHALGPGDPAGYRSRLVAEGRWARDRVAAAVASGEALDDADAGRLVAAVTLGEIRDVVWAEISRAEAPAHVRLWTDLVRRCPVALAARPAALLAFAAWQAGDGALAWCAIDRSLDSDPATPMAHIVASFLRAALPPSRWPGLPPDVLTLFAD